MEMILRTAVRPLPRLIERDTTERPYITLCSGLGCFRTANIFALLQSPRTVVGRPIQNAAIVVLLPSKLLHVRRGRYAGSAGWEGRILCAGRCIIDHTRAGSRTRCGGALRLRQSCGIPCKASDANRRDKGASHCCRKSKSDQQMGDENGIEGDSSRQYYGLIIKGF